MGTFKVNLPLYVHTTKSHTPKGKFRLNLNAYNNAHRLKKNKAKQVFTEQVAEAVNKLPVFKQIKLVYTVFFDSMRRFDVANVGSIVDKFFCDVLTKEKKLEDDDYKHLPEVTYKFGNVDRDNPRVEVQISEVR